MAKKSTRKPKVPAIYKSKTSPRIQMSTQGLKLDKDKFISIWKGTANAKGADLNKEWIAYRSWRNKYRD